MGKGQGKSKKGKGHGRGGNPTTVQSTNPGDNIPQRRLCKKPSRFGAKELCHVILKPCDHGHAKAMNHVILECKSWGTSLQESDVACRNSYSKQRIRMYSIMFDV